MSIKSFRQCLSGWMAIALLLCAGLALAQPSPTMNQVYEAAKAGRFEQAETMMQQVLVAYPKSAKAHFVLAELLARQDKLDRAREALGKAEQLAPGLPFAKPEAVQALRTQMAGKRVSSSSGSVGKSTPSTNMPAKEPSSFPWTLALVLGAGLIAIGIFSLRRKPAPLYAPQGAYPNQAPLNNAMSGPQEFGTGGAVGGAMPQGYPPQTGSGLGGRVMGGLAAGLAVGAGVMAAQAIGKSLTGTESKPDQPASASAGNGYEPIANNDLGGQNFGVNDAASWDDGSAIASGGDDGGWEG